MISPLPTTVKGDVGVSGVGLIVGTELGWHFRPQPVADVGVDAQVEPVSDDGPTGRLLGFQIKAGSSFFDETTPDGDGWVFRESSQTHRRYWLRYRLPVILVLYDIAAHAAYWQLITEESAVVTGLGFKVTVPRSQRLDSSAAETLAELARRAPTDPFSILVAGLPPACADSLVALMETAPALAQELAEALANGRDDPATAVKRAQAGSSPRWPWLAWSALADYAGEYGLNRLAADCLLHVDDGRTDENAAYGRFKAYAGIFLVTDDPQRARRLLTDASTVPGGILLAAIGLAALDHGEREGPIPIPSIVTDQSQQAAADATVQRFLADHAALSGDIETAISFHEKALELAPQSSTQMLALAEALLRRPQPLSGTTHLADYQRAASLAAKAREARRQCRADSVPAATILLHALNLSGDERSAIQVATPALDGDANETEAASPALAFYAARLCYELGDVAAGDRFAETAAAADEPRWTAHCAAVKASNCGASTEEQIQRWQAFLETSAPDDQRLVALNHLAELGVWPLPDLERMHSVGFLTEGTYDTLHAKALAAAGRHDDALVLLRRRCNTSIITAEAYARQLAQRGLVDDSVRVCEETTLRFGDPRLDLLALDVLTQAGRTDEVITRASDLLGQRDLPFNMRHRLRRQLIEVHGTRQEWLKCERLAQTGLAEVQHHRQAETVPTREPFAPALADLQALHFDYSWALIISRNRRGQIDEAFETLKTLDPLPVTAVQIATWANLHRAHGWTSETAEQALSLATQDGVPRAVAGPILLSLLQSCQDPTPERDPDDASITVVRSALAVEVSEGFNRRLGDAWTTFLGRNPSAVRTFNGDDPQLAEQLRDLLLPQATGYEQALAAVRAGQLPLGALSAAARKPYLLSLVQNAAGMIAAVTPIEQVHDQEVNAAREALGGTIAVEGSALYVAASASRLWSAARDAFLRILIAEPAAQDVVLSHISARDTANTVGTLGADTRSNGLRITTMTDTVRLHDLEDSAKILRASQECRSIAVADLALLGTRLTETTAPWLAPVAVAQHENVALYSDDACLRALASSCGVRAFGSLALLEVLIECEHIDGEAAETIVEDLFRNDVVDLANVWPLVSRMAQADGSSARPVLTNVRRSAFWLDVGTENLVGVISTLAHYVERQPRSVGVLTSAMASGLTATFGPPEQLLAILGVLVLVQATDLTPDSAEPVLRAIQQAAAPQGVDPFPPLRQNLVMTLSDPEHPRAKPREEAEQVADHLLRVIDESLS